MKNCFLQLLDVSKCGSGGPINLSDLHIISYKSLAEVAKPEKDSSAEDVLSSLANLAAMRLETDVWDFFKSYRIPKNQRTCFGRLQRDANKRPISQNYLGQNGVSIIIKPSKYLVIRPEIVFFSTIQDQSVRFFIERDSVDVWEKTVTLDLGENIILVDETFPADYVTRTFFIGYDQGVEAWATTGGFCEREHCRCWDCIDCACSCAGGTSNSTGGMIINIELECSIERLICKNVMRFKNAMIFGMGIEYLFQNIASFRKNATTMSKHGTSWELLMTEYKDRYQKSILATIRGMDLCDDCCFECKPIMSNVYVRP